MKNFSVDDLKYAYNWNTANRDDNKWIKGFPENHMLNLEEGFEVLPFLNRYMTEHGYLTIETLHKLETLIREALPKTMRSHWDIKIWLDQNCCF